MWNGTFKRFNSTMTLNWANLSFVVKTLKENAQFEVHISLKTSRMVVIYIDVVCFHFIIHKLIFPVIQFCCMILQLKSKILTKNWRMNSVFIFGDILSYLQVSHRVTYFKLGLCHVKLNIRLVNLFTAMFNYNH